MALKRIKEHMLGFRNGFNSETFTATANQTLFTLTNGSYQVGKNRLEVYIQGAKQAAGAFSETSENSFTLSEGVPVGTLVEAKWYETIIPAVGGHNQSHLKGGVDELDVTKLKNFKENVTDKFTSVDTQLAENTNKNNSEWINVKHPPNGLNKAVGDFVADDTTAIQACCDYAYNNGGGIVFVPEGHYKTSKAIRVKDNVTLFGSGYKSWIDNVTVSGFERCVVITGNIGAIGNGKSIFDEPQYNLNEIQSGSQTVTFSTLADADGFNVGDIVFIQSQEKWTTDVNSPDRFVGKYLNMNIVTSKTNGTLTLKYTIPDHYPATPVIAKFSGSVNGNDGSPLWMAKNAVVKDLRLTHKMGQTSGYYTVFSCGIDCLFERLWLDNSSTPFGSNALGYSIVRDINGVYDAGAADFCDYQISNIYENMTLSRVGLNTNVNTMGFVIHDGSDNKVINCNLNFDNKGGLHASLTQRTEFLNNKLYKPLSESIKSAIFGSKGDGFKCDGNTVYNGKYHGIYVAGNKSICVNNKIIDNEYAGSYIGILLGSSVTDSIINNNVIGATGSRTEFDTVKQETIWNDSNITKGNAIYDHQNNYVNTAFSSINNSTIETVLRTYNLKKTVNSRSKTIKVKASGNVTGTAGTKSIKLKIAGNVITSVDCLSTENGIWTIDATISHQDFGTTPRCQGMGFLGNSGKYNNAQSFTNVLANDVPIELTGVVSNSLDNVVVYLFDVSVS